MRPSLFILGILAATLCIAQPAEAQNGGWCAYYNYGFGGQRICGFATLQQCLADVRGVGGNCSWSRFFVQCARILVSRGRTRCRAC
jgi:hypothetical protein